MIEKLRTPPYIFIVYMLASGIVIMCFKLIFPGSPAPLAFYARDWRFIQGALAFFNLYPALAFSALVIPFGLVSGYEEQFQSFSEMFFKKLSVSVIIAVAAAVIYGLIFFLALPAVKNREENMRYAGDLYKMARQHMQEKRDAGNWREAAQFLEICDRIWFNNQELADIKTEINLNMDKLRLEELKDRQEAREALYRSSNSANYSALSGGAQPVNAVEAMNMARIAFDEQKYFDAHWLATLAGRIALPGSPEIAASATLASEAWNKISALEPNPREIQQHRVFTLKMDGYQAMNSGDWIRAFYIFKRLTELSPDDPDVKNFLAASEKGAKETAFFIDEMELALGEILTGAVFSLPTAEDGGRAVLRFSSLTASDDVAYGMGFEYMSFDSDSNMTASVQSRFAKITTFVLNDQPQPQLLILMHALDRDNENISYDSEYLFGEKTPGGLILDISFDDFLLLGEIRKGLLNLQMGDLFEAANIGANTGYVHQIFQAEIVNRIGSALFFLPMAIFIIIIGWRYRAKKRPRYLFAIMLPVLPVVFNGFVFLYRSVFNLLGIWLVINLGFAGALTIYIVLTAAGIFASLIALAAQHT